MPATTYHSVHPTWASAPGKAGPSAGARELEQRLAGGAEGDGGASEYTEDDAEHTAEGEDEVDSWGEYLPGQKPHACTDTIWLVLFVVLLVGAGWIIQYYVHLAEWKHNLLRFFPRSLTDYRGDLCQNRSLFFCLTPALPASAPGNATLHFDLKYRVCREGCPTSSQTVTACYDPDLGIDQNVMDYSTFIGNAFGQAAWRGERSRTKICLPLDPQLRNEIYGVIGARQFSSLLVRVIKAVYDNFRIILFSGAWIIVLGYVFLFLIDHAASAKCLVYASIAVEIVMPLYLAARIASEELLNGSSHTWVHQRTDVAAVTVLVLIFFVCMCLACALCGGLDLAIGCVEAAAECLFDEPSLLLEPIIGMLPKVCVLTVSPALFVMLISQAAVFRPDQPLSCVFEFTPDLLIASSLWVCLTCWWVLIFHHMSAYVLADVAQAWYYKKKRRWMYDYGADEVSDEELSSSGGIGRPYYNLLRYHMGSVAKGSFLSLLFGPFRFCFGVLHSIEAEDMPCAKCITLCCGLCLHCFEVHLQYICKDAYMDMAVECSSDFMTSARRAREIQEEQKVTIERFHAARFLLFASNMGLFTSSTAGVTYLCCRRIPNFPVQVTDWQPMVVCSIIMSVLIGSNFLLILDTIGDTLFFILAAERRRWRENHRLEDGIDQMRRRLQQEHETSGLLSALSCLWRAWDDHEANRMNQEVYTPEKLVKVLKMMESQHP